METEIKDIPLIRSYSISLVNNLREAQRKARKNYTPYESAYDKLKRQQAVEQLLLNYREWTTNMINKTQEWTKSQMEQQDGEIKKLQGKYDGIESLINQAVSKSEERSTNMTIQLTTKVAKEAEEMINKAVSYTHLTLPTKA